MNELTHLDGENRPAMVDIALKNSTVRTASAGASVYVNDAIWNLLEDGDIQTKKGSVLNTAIIAGTMAAKKTSDLIPFCHALSLDSCKFSFDMTKERVIQLSCTVKTENKTGVEMEALTGASVAALTIYDMCKAMSHEIEISEIRLLSKTGGKKDYHAE